MISKKKIEVVILCGGYGKRIRKISNGKPKPLIDFFNKPFLYIILNNLEKLNIKNIILLTFYKSWMFKKIKNKKEIKNMINSHILDGVALTKFIFWIKN